MNRSVGVVIPAYDPNVPKMVSYVQAIRKAIPVETVRIELDAPGSPFPDERLSQVDAHLNICRTRRGKGAAITHGFDHLDTDVLAFADADGSTPPSSFRDVVTAITNAELSVGSRRHPEARILSNQSRTRQRMGNVFAKMARVVLGTALHDFQCGVKALTSDAWDTIREHVRESGFAWDLAVIGMAHAYDMEIVEVPITWEDQPGSTVDPVRTALDLMVALLAVNHRMKLVSGNRLHKAMSRVRDDLETPRQR